MILLIVNHLQHVEICPNNRGMQIRESFDRRQKQVYYWLLTGCFLVGMMVVIGGITRLTQSGLSMVTWDPVMGAIPPLSTEEWEESFELYKSSPEFIHYHSHFTLSDYKQIFFWEYLHRLLGRIIGLVFLIPCAIFWIKGYLDKNLKKHLLIIFVLGGFQGLLGWFMVKSGLVDVPHVSHYRLASHLIMAIFLMIYIYQTALNLKYIRVKRGGLQFWKRVFTFLFSMVFVQIIYGAFVAGLKAGFMYNTFPLMNGQLIPDEFGIIYEREGFYSLFEAGGIVQFIHRTIAIILGVIMILIVVKIRGINFSREQLKSIYIVASIMFIQILLGILTLLYMVPVSLGVIHQVVAIVLILACTRLLFVFKKE